MSVVLHVMRARDAQWRICDDKGERLFWCRARSAKDAAWKWQHKHGGEIVRIVTYKGRFHASELAMTIADIQERSHHHEKKNEAV
jgi:hypothetical protein